MLIGMYIKLHGPQLMKQILLPLLETEGNHRALRYH